MILKLSYYHNSFSWEIVSLAIIEDCHQSPLTPKSFRKYWRKKTTVYISTKFSMPIPHQLRTQCENVNARSSDVRPPGLSKRTHLTMHFGKLAVLPKRERSTEWLYTHRVWDNLCLQSCASDVGCLWPDVVPFFVDFSLPVKMGEHWNAFHFRGTGRISLI